MPSSGGRLLGLSVLSHLERFELKVIENKRGQETAGT